VITEHTAPLVPQPTDNPSIDDLFSHSPSPAPPHTNAQFSIPLVRIDTPGSSDNEQPGVRLEMTPESIDEQAVVDTLFPDTDGSYGDSPIPESPLVLDTIPQEIPRVEQHGIDGSIQSSSHPHHTDDTAPVIEEGGPSPSTASSPDAEVRRKKREGKRREVSFETEIVSDSEDGASQTGGGGRKERKTRRRDSNILRTPQGVGARPDYRELGSLSPTSTNLLTQLLPSPTRAMTPILEPQPQEGTADAATKKILPVSLGQMLEHIQPAPLFPPISQTPIPRTPVRSTSPIRFSSPARANRLQSPAKPRLQPAALDDPNRTPARRIPIQEAVMQGHVSPQKAAQLTVDIGRTPVFNIRPTDSPARRVNITEARTPSGQKKWQGIRFGSPTRQRSASIEPQPAVPFTGRTAERVSLSQRMKDVSASGTQTLGSSSTSSAAQRPAKLPFPIVASRSNLPSSISEEFEGEPEVPQADMDSPVKPSATSSSPIKSTLKQTTSRIPRGVKPYARPVPKPIDKEKVKPTVMRTVELPKLGEGGRISLV
jgi:hypothetical protein